VVSAFLAGMRDVWGAETRFSRCEAVFVDQSAEPISTLDMAWSRRPDRSKSGLLRIGRSEVERAVRPVAVVVLDEDAQHVLEVPPVDDEEPVETLGPDGADEALGDRIRPRRSNGRPDDLDPFAVEDRVEVTSELAVAIADQEAERVGCVNLVTADLQANRPGRAPRSRRLQRAWIRRLLEPLWRLAPRSGRCSEGRIRPEGKPA
jgi:hypothetical protein